MKPLTAALLIAVFFLIEALAASETLHEWFHDDAHGPDHECVVKAFQSGLVHFTPPAVEFDLPPVVLAALPPVEVSLFSASELLLPPGRAPPGA